MRRLLVAATLCAITLLGAAPTAWALAAPLQPVPDPQHAPFTQTLVSRAPFAFEPLARRILSGAGTISLNVYTYDSQPEANAAVRWQVITDTDSGSGSGTTDTNGHIDLSGVPAATNADGQITVVPVTTPSTEYDLTHLSWDDTGWSAGVQPGRLPMTLVRSSQRGWDTWKVATVHLWAQNLGGEQYHAVSHIAGTGASTPGYAQTISTGVEPLTKGSIYYWINQGMELPVAGITVSAGSLASPTVTADQSQAQRVWMDYWGSGKPGTTTWVWLNDYPDGWVNDVLGLADYPATAKLRSLGSSTTDGATNDVKKLVIPATAAPGYAYWIAVEHRDGPLALQTWFQTCTLKPSKSTVSRGATISLSGVVPIKGHYGSKKGAPKYVTVYKTTSATVARYQPSGAGGGTSAKAWRSGIGAWSKVGRVRTDGLGRYRRGSVNVAQTTWYCAWYPGDAQYSAGWTSVLKETAR